MNWKLIRAVSAITTLGLLAGCGGGGGGSTEVADAYTISLRTDNSTLPLNIAYEGPRIGGAYTTTLYVEARDSEGNSIPGGDEIFGCNITEGLDSGALYYLDGDPAHETTETVDGVEITTPNAYRSVTLGANSGGNSFHFHAYDIASTVKIRCSVTDLGGVSRSIEATIQVGGTPTGKVSQIVFDQISPNYLFVQGVNGTTQVQIQANLVDEAGQFIGNPTSGTNNLQVRIVPSSTSTAEDDAELRGVNSSGQAVSGSSIHIPSINGQAQFTLVSGTHAGTILLEAVSDRADNNVSNGILQPVFNYTAISVVTEAPATATPVTITTSSLPSATGNIPYGALLEGSGGTAPYTWSLASAGLPSGLSLSASGVISGTPSGSTSGTYNFVAKVTDKLGTTSMKQLSIPYTAPEPPPAPEPTAPGITTSSLSSGTVGTPYLVVMTAYGGDGSYIWSAAGLPAGLAMSSFGVLSGTPTGPAGTYPVAVSVTSAGFTTTKSYSLVIN